MQNYIDKLDPENAFSLDKNKKTELFLQALKEITSSHYRSLKYYQNILDSFLVNFDQINTCEDIPFLPARFFKDTQSHCVDGRGVTLSSSGTTGQKSYVYLDESDILLQKKVLYHIGKSFIGKERKPMIVLSNVENGTQLSAKSAGVLGFMLFGRNVKLVSNQDDFLAVLQNQINLYGDNLLIYGTTIDIYLKMIKCKYHNKIDLTNSIVIMGGGWKNSNIELSQKHINNALYENWGIKKIFDFYGMAEQAGSIFFCCEHGNYHSSDYSNIIVRHPITFKPCQIGETGILQVLSSLPMRQPNHSILTEDYGMILGEDDCPCGRMGKYFAISGRLQASSPKGCSYEN